MDIKLYPLEFPIYDLAGNVVFWDVSIVYNLFAEWELSITNRLLSRQINPVSMLMYEW